MSEQPVQKIILNGDLKEAGQFFLPVDSRAVRYGDGCFETMRSYEGAFLELEQHLDRLQRGLAYLGIKAPLDLDSESFLKNCSNLLQANNLEGEQAVIRMQVWREGGRGFNVLKMEGAAYSISATPLPEIASSVSLATVNTRRIPRAALDPRYKLSNSINYIRAASEASRQGADDALMQTVDGYISETTIANIFWIKDGEIFTPSVYCDILPGITRSIILELLNKELNIVCRQGQYGLDHIQEASAACICNSLRELVPIRNIDKVSMETSHPLFLKLKEAFENYKRQALTKD